MRLFSVGFPALLILLFAGVLITWDVPNNVDRLSESSEPLRTLKFFYTRGRALSKWPPMPQFVYAPVYAVPMAYWYLTGDLKKPMMDYPYGLTRPFEQQGLLIVLARSVGLAIGIGCVVFYGRALFGLTGSALAVFLALTLCLATSPEVDFAFVSTKPDGLMVAFLAASMAIYTDILAKGLTRRRGILLSLLAVFSISCKELTAPLYPFAYAGVACAGWVRSGGDSAHRRRFLADFAIAIATGVAAYFLLNVVYAPATWLARMEHWLVGSGKDPAVWAPSWYTTSDYLREVYRGLFVNLGPGGMALVAVSLALSILAPVEHRFLAWLPSLGFLGYMVATAGYMPPYFMSPLNATLALPVAAALAMVQRRWLEGSGRAVRAAVAVPIAVLCLLNLWHGSLTWARACFSAVQLEERYCERNVDKKELIHTSNIWVRQSGSDRLSYLGFNVDDRPLGELVDRPRVMPDVILISGEHLSWMNDFKNRPARNKGFEGTGYSYSRFEGFETLGYRLADTVRAEPRWLVRPPWIDPNDPVFYSQILVYRRDTGR